MSLADTCTPNAPGGLSLDLRCREAEWLDRPETLGEFARLAPSRDEGHRQAALVEVLVADVVARALFDVDAQRFGRPLLSCDSARFPIPTGVRDLERPAVEHWRSKAQLEAELLESELFGGTGARSLPFRLGRSLIAAAGALPLLLTPTLVQAASPLDPLTGMSEGFAPATKQPTKPGKSAKEDPKPEPAPEVVPEPPPEVTPEPVPPPAPAIVLPKVDENLSLAGRSLWAGLDGKTVVLTMKDGQTLSCKIVAQTGNDLAVARSSDGTVVAVPKAEIAGVQLRNAKPMAAAYMGGPRPTEDGFKIHAGGIAMVVFGGVAVLSGTVMLAITPYFVAVSLPLLLPGIAVVGSSVSMFRAAKRKRRAYNEAWGLPEMSKVQFMPTVGLSRNGGQAGLVLRF
ncbi:MAG: hypothetical protein KC457_25685 [Myxococcales bacterium]|nr:hypothetical protein [Myxococcales bacterium]